MKSILRVKSICAHHKIIRKNEIKSFKGIRHVRPSYIEECSNKINSVKWIMAAPVGNNFSHRRLLWCMRVNVFVLFLSLFISHFPVNNLIYSMFACVGVPFTFDAYIFRIQCVIVCVTAYIMDFVARICIILLRSH